MKNYQEKQCPMFSIHEYVYIHIDDNLLMHVVDNVHYRIEHVNIEDIHMG